MDLFWRVDCEISLKRCFTLLKSGGSGLAPEKILIIPGYRAISDDILDLYINFVDLEWTFLVCEVVRPNQANPPWLRAWAMLKEASRQR